MKINLDRQVKTLKGDTCPMSFPGVGDLERVKKETGKQEITLDLMPKETVGNMLLNMVANYEVRNRREIFDVNQLGIIIAAGGDVEIPEKLVPILRDQIIPASVIMRSEETGPDGEKREKVSGLYHAWSVAQVLDEMGVTA